MKHYLVYDGNDLFAFSTVKDRADEAFDHAVLRADDPEAIRTETIDYCPDQDICPCGSL